jgi:hypothetical protein
MIRRGRALIAVGDIARAIGAEVGGGGRQRDRGLGAWGDL